MPGMAFKPFWKSGSHNSETDEVVDMELSFPTNLRYSRQHEWIRVEGAVSVIGITAFAQDQLGNVVFVELPSVGSTVVVGQIFGSVESVKTVSDLFSPVTGEVVAVNTDLEQRPETVNQDPYGSGWMIKVRLADEMELTALLDVTAYQAFVGAESV